MSIKIIRVFVIFSTLTLCSLSYERSSVNDGDNSLPLDMKLNVFIIAILGDPDIDPDTVVIS